MSQTDAYASELHLARPPDAEFDALTSLTGLAGWWSPMTGDAAAGGELRHPLVISVEAAERPREVAWAVADYPLQPDWVGTRITFTLRAEGDGTVVEFCHDGLTPRLECSQGWDHFLPSLRDYVETGSGRPFADRRQR
ncbi:SRPBCC family protein [Nonomuraea sediminis]|uniref:SRPBCC family protein n=1 Tax=Nonomuraea sediminis TaxID=2835864 RepID=UPI001BDC01E1|nr:SRPBCC domain-containing protein [Nonomuraea sediminis]